MWTNKHQDLNLPLRNSGQINIVPIALILFLQQHCEVRLRLSQGLSVNIRDLNLGLPSLIYHPQSSSTSSLHIHNGHVFAEFFPKFVNGTAGCMDIGPSHTYQHCLIRNQDIPVGAKLFLGSLLLHSISVSRVICFWETAFCPSLMLTHDSATLFKINSSRSGLHLCRTPPKNLIPPWKKEGV